MTDRAEILREYEGWYKRHAAHSEYPHIREFRAPERVHRWRVALECGCTTEALTFGTEYPPTKGVYYALRTDIACASDQLFLVDAECSSEGTFPGFLWCGGHDGQPPWREIAEWRQRKYERRSESGKLYAHWAVKLSCGHLESVVTEADWRPDMGHRPNLAAAEKMRALLSSGTDMGTTSVPGFKIGSKVTGRNRKPEMSATSA